MDVTAGDTYRLRVPEWAETIGQGDPPAGLSITRDDHTRTIPWGTVVQASETCDKAGEIAGMSSTPPRVRLWAIEELHGQFELVEAASADASPADASTDAGSTDSTDTTTA